MAAEASAVYLPALPVQAVTIAFLVTYIGSNQNGKAIFYCNFDVRITGKC